MQHALDPYSQAMVIKQMLSPNRPARMIQHIFDPNGPVRLKQLMPDPYRSSRLIRKCWTTKPSKSDMKFIDTNNQARLIHHMLRPNSPARLKQHLPDTPTHTNIRLYSYMSQCVEFPTMWHFDMCRLGRTSVASF